MAERPILRREDSDSGIYDKYGKVRAGRRGPAVLPLAPGHVDYSRRPATIVEVNKDTGKGGKGEN